MGDSTELVRAIGDAVGEQATVRRMENFSRVLVQDLDELAEEEEIRQAVATFSSGDSSKVRVIKMMDMGRGQRRAILSLPDGAARTLVENGRLRVGLVNCRVRAWETRRSGRCPKCLSSGHEVDSCVGPDRRNSCRECGATGHLAATCAATVEARQSFKAILDLEAAGGSTQQPT